MDITLTTGMRVQLRMSTQRLLPSKSDSLEDILAPFEYEDYPAGMGGIVVETRVLLPETQNDLYVDVLMDNGVILGNRHHFAFKSEQANV